MFLCVGQILAGRKDNSTAAEKWLAYKLLGMVKNLQYFWQKVNLKLKHEINNQKVTQVHLKKNHNSSLSTDLGNYSNGLTFFNPFSSAYD